MAILRVDSIASFSRVNFIGSRCASIFKAACDVALKAPVMYRAALVCMFSSVLSMLLLWPLYPSGVYYTDDLYVICGSTVAL